MNIMSWKVLSAVQLGPLFVWIRHDIIFRKTETYWEHFEWCPYPKTFLIRNDEPLYVRGLPYLSEDSELCLWRKLLRMSVKQCLINNVCIENSEIQAVSEIKNTLVEHSLNCVCVCACMHIWGCYMAFLVIFTWYSVRNCVSVVSIVTRLQTW
jgi:hypothetical protein